MLSQENVQNLGFYSPRYLQLIRLLSANEGMRRHRICAESDNLVDFMKTYEYDYGAWPMIISKARVAEFDAFIKVFPDMVYKAINSYFQGDSREFSRYFQSPALIYELLQDAQIDNRELLNRYDTLYCGQVLKILEVNSGSNIGGWQLDYLHPQFSRILASYRQTRQWHLKQRHAVNAMLTALTDCITRTLPETSKGNILIYFQDDKDDGLKQLRIDLANLYQEIKPEHFPEGKIMYFSDCADISFTGQCRVKYRQETIDVLIMPEPDRPIFPDNFCRQLIQSRLANRLIFPDSPLHTIIGNKHALALLHEEAVQQALSAEEVHMINRHVPWTAKMTREAVFWRGERWALRQLLIREQAAFVIKKSHSLQGRDVYVGRYLQPDAWLMHLDEVLGEGDWLAQEFCQADPVLMCDQASGLNLYRQVWGVFDINNAYGGAFVRANPLDGGNGVINSANGATEFAVFEEA
ncbi:hypothetical protein SG34_031330 [Thalassomonas viridans]|uniref:Glutathionylspermidine synthase pre-ATP-grasp-like domain-containing protein n=1 Tax=Thalassomonas viridans TaxID=137584 RepID=A0AAE9ZA25_9GAMM|nr:hypothetical protein [Thalassomonas viridans]WDE09258.1 hypothetical protein SG34_031330 [Thalassomonas viridans]